MSVPSDEPGELRVVVLVVVGQLALMDVLVVVHGAVVLMLVLVLGVLVVVLDVGVRVRGVTVLVLMGVRVGLGHGVLRSRHRGVLPCCRVYPPVTPHG